MTEVKPAALVVDDEGLLAQAMAAWLRHHGWQVVMVTTGEDALAAMEAGARFRAVLCDVHLPGMSGIELHARVRERWPEMADHFVFVSGAVPAEFRERFEALPNRRLRKPFDLAEVGRLFDQMR